MSGLFRGSSAAIEVAMNATACCAVGNGKRFPSRSLQVAQHNVADWKPFLGSTDNLHLPTSCSKNGVEMKAAVYDNRSWKKHAD